MTGRHEKGGMAATLRTTLSAERSVDADIEQRCDASPIPPVNPYWTGAVIVLVKSVAVSSAALIYAKAHGSEN